MPDPEDTAYDPAAEEAALRAAEEAAIGVPRTDPHWQYITHGYTFIGFQEPSNFGRFFRPNSTNWARPLYRSQTTGVILEGLTLTAPSLIALDVEKAAYLSGTEADYDRMTTRPSATQDKALAARKNNSRVQKRR